MFFLIGATVSVLAPVATSILTGLANGFDGLSNATAASNAKVSTGFSITSTALQGASDIVDTGAAILTGRTTIVQGAIDITTSAIEMAKDITADALTLRNSLTLVDSLDIVGTQPDVIG